MAEKNYQIRPLQGVDIDWVIVLDKHVGGETRADFFHKRLQATERSPDTYISLSCTL
ncbi:MAG: hypothetical protein ABW168_25765 [Sedimenticola sp.]